MSGHLAGATCPADADGSPPNSPRLHAEGALRACLRTMRREPGRPLLVTLALIVIAFLAWTSTDIQGMAITTPTAHLVVEADALTTRPQVVVSSSGPPAASCLLRFVSYTASDFEVAWRSHARKYDAEPARSATGVCVDLTDAAMPWLAYSGLWMRASAAMAGRLAAGPADASLPTVVDLLAETAPRVFSTFTHVDTCTGERIVTAIEPLGGLIRDPTSPCVVDGPGEIRGRTALLKKELPPGVKGVLPAQSRLYLLNDPLFHSTWLAMAARAAVAAPPSSQSEAGLPVRPRRLLIFDAGASFYSSAGKWKGATGLKWLLETQKALGVPVDSMDIYAWEADKREGTTFFDGMPMELAARTHFYNFPITSSASVGNFANPLNVIRAVARPGDYVLFKLDVDVAELELRILDALLAEPALLSLVTELYWEPHFWVRDTAIYHWQRYKGYTLSSSIAMLRKLREAGVRAHPWP